MLNSYVKHTSYSVNGVYTASFDVSLATAYIIDSRIWNSANAIMTVNRYTVNGTLSEDQSEIPHPL